MIKYNVKLDEYRNHRMDGKYGVLIGNIGYAGYPLTIVDNSREVENGKYAGIPSLCLIHLNERVREYASLRVGDDFYYLGFYPKEPTYKMYDYKYGELSTEQIIQDLKTVIYYSEPNLQGRSLVSWRSKKIEDDPNYYEGRYVLNNEEEYTILKCKDKYRFYRGKKNYCTDWEKEEGLIYEDTIDFNIYKKALEVSRLREEIVTKTNELLDSDDIADTIMEYKLNKSELENLLNIK